MRLLTARRGALSLPATLCLALAAGLSGCASKNPLMDEPAPVAASKPAASAPVASAPAMQAAPAATPAPTSSVTPAVVANTGVQTSKERRLFDIFSPYRPTIQQGNFVSREMLTQLKTGMTPDQVRFVLGTPLLTDIFHADRWDYVFRLKKRDGEVIASRIAVFFKDNRVARIDAGELPTEKDYLSLIAGTPPAPITDAK